MLVKACRMPYSVEDFEMLVTNLIV